MKKKVKKGTTAYHIVLEFESNMQEYYAREYENMRQMIDQAEQAGQESPFIRQEGEMHWEDFPVEDVPMNTDVPTMDEVVDALDENVAAFPSQMVPADRYNIFRINYRVTEDSAKSTFEDISRTLSSMGITSYDIKVYNYEGPGKWNDVTESVLTGDKVLLPGNMPEGIALKLNMQKKAWDNPPRDDATYPGSNVSGPVPREIPKSPSNRPRRDQRTVEDYHAPSQLDRDRIPGGPQPEENTGGQSHSGEPGKPDNIYPEPSNWLRPLKGLPFTDEHLMHDFNEDFDTEYIQRQRGLNMRKRKKIALNLKNALEVPKWTDPEFLGSALYDHVKDVLHTYADMIRENPEFEDKFLAETIPEYITRERDLFISAGVTRPIMLDAIKEAVNLLAQDSLFVDTLHSEEAAVRYYPEGLRQQTFEMPQMSAEESEFLNNHNSDEIWDIARNDEIVDTAESQIARSLIQKGIIASKVNMRRYSSDFLNEINTVISQWQQTAEASDVNDVLNIFNDRARAYDLVMQDLTNRYPKDIAQTLAIEIIDAVPRVLRESSKFATVNPKYANGSLQTSDVSETVINAIKDIQKGIDTDKLYTKEDEPGWVKDGKQQLFHITVLFGVDDDVEDKVKEIFDKYKPISIETTGVEYFDTNPDFDVAIVKCKSAELTKMHNELKSTLDNEDSYSTYNPHITIAYLNKGEKLDDAQISNSSWEINSLELSTSEDGLKKISALAVPIRESLDYPHSWNKKKDKKKEDKKKEVSEKEKKILQMDSNKLDFKKNAATSLIGSGPKTFTSILDEPRASLDEAIWDIGEDDLPVLKPDIKVNLVENFLVYIADFGGYIKPEQWIKNMFYTGSTATYTYTDTSDVDIHVIVDWADLMALNPDKAKEDLMDMWQELHDVFWWTLNRQKLPGTKHPMQYYVVRPGEEQKMLEAKEELYDIGHEVWLVPPAKQSIVLPEDAMNVAVEEASDIVSRIEEHLANAKKGIIDYDMLKILERLNGANTPVILQKFDEILKALDKELVALKYEYATLKQKRQEAFESGKPIALTESKNYTLGNIIFKLVERYKLMQVLREIKRITDAEPTKHDQVDDVADALGFADNEIS